MSPIATRDLTKVARGFHAVSDPIRVQVLELLRDGELCVCELMAALEAAQSRLSFHLKVLKEAGLITDRREGRWVYYTLNRAAVVELEGFLADLQNAHPKRVLKSVACCN